MILSPRDLIVYRLTDQVVTDSTFASRSGLYDFDGNAVRELAGPGTGKAPEHRRLRHRGRPAEAGAGRRARAATGDPRGHRCRRPPVRGPGVRGVRAPPHGELGDHGQRLHAGARAPRALPGGRRGHAGGRRGLAARGWALGRRPIHGVARAAPRPHARRAGAPGCREPARRAWGGRSAVARRCPRPVVARRRPGGVHGSGRRPRRQRPGAGRGGGGGLGRRARHGSGDGRPSRWCHSGRRHPGRLGRGAARVDQGPDLCPRDARHAAPLW